VKVIDNPLPLPAYTGILRGMPHSNAPQLPKSRGCTCLRLRKASRRVSQIYDQHLEPFGLTVTQYGVLGHLATLNGIRISELAEKLVMDPTTLTRNLGPLQRQGLLAVKTDRRDRRARSLQLTAHGQKVFEKAKPGWAQAQRHVEQLFGDLETPALNAALDRILEKLAT
jgi:DNA-binding MarR family transcriptional regulator